MKQSTSLTIAILTALSLLFGCAYYNILFNAKKSYEEGIKEIIKSPDRTQVPSSAKRYFEATIDKCWKLIDLFSDKSKYADDALLYICKSEYYLEKYTQSKLHLEQFLRKYPESKLIPEAHLWYGKTLMRLEEFENAEESLRSAINSSNSSKIHAEAYFEIGSVDFDNGEYETAIEYYQKALDEDPDDQYRALLQFNLGEAFYIQKNYEQAIKHFKKVEDNDPSIDIEYQTKLHMADSYSETGKYENAHKILRKMLTAPRFKDFLPIIKTAIGENYEKQQRYQDAMEIYRETIAERKPNPGTAQAAFNLAGIYETVFRNVDSATVYYSQVGKLYSRFDSLETAKNKEVFLRGLKDIRDNIKRDARLVFKLENDPYFRDSLYNAQYEDSIKLLLNIDSVKVDSPSVVEPLTQQSPAFGDSSWGNPQDSIENALNNNFPGQGQDTAEVPIGEVNENEPQPPIEGLDEIEPNQPPGEGEEEVQPPEPVEHRKLPQIKQNLKSERYQLAEYHLLKTENYDSAMHYFKKFLSQYEDSLLTPKALYSLRFIYKRAGHESVAKVDSLESMILNQYPGSIFAEQILKQRGILTEKEDEETTHENSRQLFMEAESLYFAENFEQALQKYDRITEIDTSSEWSAKAMYAKAWIYEKDLHEKELALNTYEKIIEEYPEIVDYTAIARKKTTPLPEETTPSPEDTLIATSTTVDTAQATEEGIPGDIVPETGPVAASQIIEEEKIVWRMRRYRR